MIFDRLLDGSILFSFDRSGYERHLKGKEAAFPPCSRPLNALVTGASKGIGSALAEGLTASGVSLFTAGRSWLEGQYLQADLGNLFDVRALSGTPSLPPLDILVHNAGSMPLTRLRSQQGEEEIFASQVFGPYCLTKSLLEGGKAAPGMRTIFVSSGGMYLKKFSLEDLSFEKRPYNRYTAYANAKRAQLLLVKIFHQRYGDRGYMFSAMHPGWVDTQGVAQAMPLFYRLMKKRLRTPKQGADTILWLALTEEKYPGGGFWFDRAQAPSHYFSYTKESPEEIQALEEYCEKFYKAYFS